MKAKKHSPRGRPQTNEVLAGLDCSGARDALEFQDDQCHRCGCGKLKVWKLCSECIDIGLPKDTIPRLYELIARGDWEQLNREAMRYFKRKSQHLVAQNLAMRLP